MGYINSFESFFYVSFGALIGANIRFYIYLILKNLSFKIHYATLIINCFASFLFGLFYSFLIHSASINYYYKISLLLLIGCVGSMSTFSAFVYDLFELSMNSNLNRVIKILIFSICFSLLSLFIGYCLGNL